MEVETAVAQEIIEKEPSEQVDEEEETEWNGVDVIESMCISCGENGITRLMTHKIPYFRELILASFECEHCGERNNEVTFGGAIQVFGCTFKLDVTKSSDLDRQIIKSDYASLSIPEIDFEIPPGTQKGEINTLEGFLLTAAKNLGMYQREREEQHPEIAAAVQNIITKLTSFSTGNDLPFTIILTDISGNSFIENPNAPHPDPALSLSHFTRTAEQDESMGLSSAASSAYRDPKESNYFELAQKYAAAPSSTSDAADLGRRELISTTEICPNCSHEGENITAITSIPHFKDLIIMGFTCSFCGFRTNDIRPGGAIPTLGTQITLTATNEEDLARDVLKSDSAIVHVPELELELQSGTLGGVYTTIEGLLMKIHTSLTEEHPFASGDSTVLHHSEKLSKEQNSFAIFCNKLKQVIQGQLLPFTLIIRDPLGNSFVGPRINNDVPPEVDPNLKLEDFQRTWEENEELGLNDMNTRDFEVTDQDPNEVILPDRITHPTPKRIDHPHVFAKAVDDSVPGGKVYSAVPASTPLETQVEEVVMKRHFDEHDAELDFLPYEEFSGRKEGYMFRMGLKGLGYYYDAKQHNKASL